MDSALRGYILLRDGGCVARYVTMPLEVVRWPMLRGLPDPGPCRNEFGSWINPASLMGMTVDHVKDRDRPSMSLKAPDDPDHLWALCPGHHTGIEAGRVWATQVGVREAALVYIAAANDHARRNRWPPYPVWDEERQVWIAEAA